MTPKKYSERKRDEHRRATNETVGVLLIIVSTFLLLCLVTKSLILGVIGSGISNILLGAFGYFVYPAILFTLILGILKFKNLSLTASTRLVCAVIFAVIVLMLMLQLASSFRYLGDNISAYLKSVYTNRNTLGGVVFGLIVYPIEFLLGKAFSYILYSLLLILAVILIIKSFIATPQAIANKRNKVARRSFADTRRTYTIATNLNVNSTNELYVGTIFDESTNYYQNEGNFDNMSERPQYTPPTSQEQEEMLEREYNRRRAREMLFGDMANFTYDAPIPSSVVSKPDIRPSKPTPEPLPRVVLPPTKHYEHQFVAGEIINGDIKSEDLRKQQNEKNEKQNEFNSMVDNNADGLNRAPIINGDFYEEGKEIPTVEEVDYEELENALKENVENTSVSNNGSVDDKLVSNNASADDKYDANNSDNDDGLTQKQNLDNSENASSNALNDDSGVFTSSFDDVELNSQELVDNSQIYNDDSDISSEGNIDDNLIEEENIGNDLIVDSTKFSETQDDLSLESEISIEENDNDNNVSEQLDLEQKVDAVLDEKEKSFLEEEQQDSIIVGDATDIDDLTSEDVDLEKCDETLDKDIHIDTPIRSEEEEKQKNLSDKFDASTTSFNIIDEVEDLSETGFNNPNDSTGYYNKVEPTINKANSTSFENRIKEIDNKINVAPKQQVKTPATQLDIDSFASDNAKKKQDEVKKEEKPVKPKKPAKYVIPPLDLLVTESTHPENDGDDTQEKISLLEEALEMLGVPAKVNGVTVGPAITRYEMDMPPGMSVKRIENLADDIRYNLASKGQIRIESPIPGKRAVGIEVPNDKIYTVALKDIIGSTEFKNSSSPLTIALGKDIQGRVMITRLDKMPHLLIAGATGSGKSSCLNSLLISLMYKASPNDVKLVLIDPKRVEFTSYNGLPHMMIRDAITDVKKAINAFKWACDEMEKRYITLQSNCVRDISEYNALPGVKEGTLAKMPFIVIIVDELANLIQSSKADKKVLEDAIVAIASKARAAGIHLVLATQRPSVDVITGTIKANLPSRIAFAVSSVQDSRIILDSGGAEALLGRGDMLFAPLNESEETRIQGAYVELLEVKSIVDFVKSNNSGEYDSAFEDYISPPEPQQSQDGEDADNVSPYEKELIDVVRCVINTGKASSALIQRRFRFGFNKAARIMDQMEDLHFVGPQEGGSKAREVLITPEKFAEFFGEPL